MTEDQEHNNEVILTEAKLTVLQILLNYKEDQKCCLSVKSIRETSHS